MRTTVVLATNGPRDTSLYWLKMPLLGWSRSQVSSCHRSLIMALPSATTPFLRLRVEVAQPDDLSNQTSDPSTLPFRLTGMRSTVFSPLPCQRNLYLATIPTLGKDISSVNSCYSGITPKSLGTTGYAATFKKDTPSMFEISVARHLLIMRW